MLKKLLSMSLAVMMMSTACWGCNNDGGGASPDDTAADNGTHDSDAYVNKSGEAFPITMLSSSASDIKPVYDPRYTEANHRFVSSMLAALDWNENAVFSPLSLQIALQVLANGADDETAEKLLSAVCPGLTLDEVNESAESLIAMIGEDGGVNIENAVVYNDILQINKRFANTAADRYAASVGALDFSEQLDSTPHSPIARTFIQPLTERQPQSLSRGESDLQVRLEVGEGGYADFAAVAGGKAQRKARLPLRRQNVKDRLLLRFPGQEIT
ncbi:MAG: hypothetical protein IIZ56_02025, partial [Clostridia bacterium]|nr:hypothetical protein [Clostridia bacterium]